MAEMLQILRIRMSDEDMQAIFAESKRVGLTPSAWARMQLKRMLADIEGANKSIVGDALRDSLIGRSRKFIPDNEGDLK